MAACPYGSRSFNFVDPRPHLKSIETGYPTRTRGVVEKCNLCAERLAVGKIPACVEACEARALVFGDLKDPSSEVARVLAKNHTIRRKPSLGTQPHVFYVT
jgi:molybdopterin-containing oxidoreductase family iron-sulfur binding subunit